MPPGIQAAQLYVGIGALGAADTLREIMRVSAAVDKVDDQEAQIAITAEGRGALSVLDETRARAEALDHSDPEVSVTAAAGGAITVIDELRARAEALDQSDPEISVTTNAGVASQQIDGLRAKLRTLAQEGRMGGFFQDLSLGRGMGGSLRGAMNPMGMLGMLQGAQMMSQGSGLMGSATMALSGGMGAGMATGGVLAAGALAVGSIMKAGEMERYQTQLEVFLGSAEKAKQRLAELTDFAKTTPFELPEVVRASKTLEVFTKGAISTGEGLRLVGDIAAGTQQPFEETAMWIGRMYDAMQSGRPFGEATMRLQEMGALSGESREKIENLAKSVKNGSMTMGEAWGVVSGEFKRFSGMMEKQSTTLEGKMSNFSDAVGQGLARLGDKLLPFAKSLLDVGIPAIEALLDGLGLLGDVAEFVSRPIGFLADRVRDFLGFIEGTGVVAWFIDGVGRMADAAGGFIDGVGNTFDSVGQKASEAQIALQQTPDAIAADLRESRAQMSVAASYGIEEPIVESMEDVYRKSILLIRKTEDEILEELRAKRSDILAAAQATAEAIYRPQIAEAEAAALAREESELRQTIASKESTAEQVADANQRLLELQATRLGLMTELATYGKLSIAEQKKMVSDLSKQWMTGTYEQRLAISRLITQLIQLRMEAQRASGALSGIGGGTGGGLTGRRDHRAMGGEVEPNQAYWVGEHGKELFVSDTPGQIYNDRDLTMMASRRNAGSAVAAGGGATVIQPIIQFPSMIPYSPGQMQEVAAVLGPALAPYLAGRGFSRA